MARHMVIAPDSPDHDRKWYDWPSYRMYFMDRWLPRTFELVDPVELEMPPTHAATKHRYYHPGWKILLTFWVDDRLGVLEPTLPEGYVMPGWVVGQKLEYCRLEEGPC